MLTKSVIIAFTAGVLSSGVIKQIAPQEIEINAGIVKLKASMDTGFDYTISNHNNFTIRLKTKSEKQIIIRL